MTDHDPPEISGAHHLRSQFTAESLQSRAVLRDGDGGGTAVRALLPEVTVVKIGGQSIIDRGPEVLLPLLDELAALAVQHPLIVTAGEGARARHVFHIAQDLELPAGMLAQLGGSTADQNAQILAALLMDRGAVNVPLSLAPVLLNSGRIVVMSGMPPYDWWEPPPPTGRIPEYRTDAGTLLTAEAFGARQLIYVKDQDGLYDRDPATHADAQLIRDATVDELRGRDRDDLPLEPVVLDLLAHARLVRRLRLINGRTPGELTRAFTGAPVGSVIVASRTIGS